MKRRAFLSSATIATVLAAGCTSDNDSGNTSTETDNLTGTDTDTGPEYDVVIEYTAHVQNVASGEYDLPKPPYDDWSWLVMDFEVVKGQLDMGDVWFNGLFETEERYYTVSKNTDGAKNGIEPRGAVREGSGGLTLHEYPPSPATEPVGPMFSATDARIGGEGVRTDGPSNHYPPVTVEYSVTTDQNPDVLPHEAKAEQGNTWAIVEVKVVEGVLNMEDVWFRSQLLTGSRVYEVDHDSKFADRGLRSRGFVKEGYSANVMYQIAEDESVEKWGYQKDNRQDVTIRRA